jgi:ABC-2 type transport system ATP-binding protein
MNEIIKLTGVTKSYNGNDVVKNVTMEIKKGRIYGFLGPNGAGKTTIMEMILNLVKPTSGTIEVFGEKVESDSYKYLKHIGSIIENPVFYNHLTAYKNLKLHCEYSGYYELDKIQEVLDLVGLKEIEKKVVSEFSLGMKQRLGIARAILTNPSILILDEPINGLDPIGIKEMRELILKLKNEYGITILISSHIISEIEHIADVIGVIRDGILLEEVDMKTIREEAVQYIEVQVNHLEKAMAILDSELKTNNFKTVSEDTIRIYDDSISQKDVSRSLIMADVDIYMITTKTDSLEDYFVNMINRIGSLK